MDMLREGLLALSIDPTPEVTKTFSTYLSELLKWNRVHNLTSITDEASVVKKHFLDSLLFLCAIPEESASVLDVGSGAGFPGVPMKIARPGLSLTLCEPRKKKAAFLRHLVSALKLNGVNVFDGRLEELTPEKCPFGRLFDAAVVRALFTVEEFVRLASPCVMPGGLMVLSKGKEYASELVNLDPASYSVTATGIPLSDVSRYIIAIRKT